MALSLFLHHAILNQINGEMAELQTLTAVTALIKLTWTAGEFLAKVKNADGLAREVCDRVERLRGVLESVHVVLKRRYEHGVATSMTSGDPVEGRICDSVVACHHFLSTLQSEVGSFETGSAPKLVDRFRLACRHSSITRRQTDLEARISILQTELVVLQL